MARYRTHLPQLDGGLFLTEGGIETTLIFHDGLDLPYFAAFDLLRDQDGRAALQRYFTRHASIAGKDGVGFILESRPGARVRTGPASSAIRQRRSLPSTAQRSS